MENDPKSKLTDDEASQAGQQISESRMRQALGIEARSSDRHVTQSHTPGSHTQGAPRRRFVTDGDVPVVMIGRRRDHGTIERADQTATLTDRVTATEAALATERDARTRAEALLAEARHTIQHLQTLVAHADLARDEAVAHARRAMAEYSEMSKQLQEARESQPPAAIVAEPADAIPAPAPVQAPVHVQAPTPTPGQPPAVGRPRRASLPAVTEAGCDVPAFTARIVASYLSRNQLSPTALPGLAESVVQALVATVPLQHRLADMHTAEATAEEGHRPRSRARAPAR